MLRSMSTPTAHALIFDEHLGPEARAVLEVTGADTERFLQGLLSADVRELEGSAALPATLLTAKGRIVSELIVVANDDGGFALIVPASRSEAVFEDLERHVIMDDVSLRARPELRVALLWGEGDEEPALDAGVLARRTTHPGPGRVLIGAQAAIDRALSTAHRASAAQWAAYRVATASPAWGHELAVDRFPPEVGFVAAVSYDKGCYRGQEPLARIHARGQVNWVMVRVEAAGGEMAVPVDLSAESRDKAGQLTTFAAGGDAPAGLAIVHRSLAQAGTVLTGAGVQFTVQTGPLGDDLGLRSN
ncbi:MAG: hypothetical protein B7733_17840 [Myxococcales bacterium FL481]|nr:MAG: hypothetical protein B7733_17840 [Myxococcales bacterium FL481]